MARKTSVSVGIRLTADGNQLIGQTRLSQEAMRKLGVEFSDSGRKAGDFSRGAQTATKSTEGLGQGISRLRGFLGALGVSLSVVGMQRLITGTTQALDVVGKLSRTTGIATEDLQRLEFAASQTGLQFNDLTKGLQRFQRRLTEDDSVAEFAASLNLRDLNTTDQLLAIAKQFEGIVDPAERAAAAARLFGRTGGTEMLKLLEEGADGIRQLTGRADELGLVLDSKAIAAAERFNDSWDEVSRSLTATLRAGVMQGLTDDTDEMSDAWEDLTELLTSQELREGIASIVSGIVSITGVAASSIVTLTALGRTIRDTLSGGPAITQDQRDRGALREELALKRSLERQEEMLQEAVDRRSEILQLQAAQETEIVRQGMQHQVDALDQMIAGMQDEQEARRERIAQLEAERVAFGDVAETLDKIVVSAGAAGDEWRNLIRQQREAARATKSADQDLQRFEAAFGKLRDQLDPVAAATRQYVDQVDLLDRAWADGLIGGEDYWGLLNRLATGAEEAGDKTQELTQHADPFADAWKRAVEDVDRAFVQLWESAFGGFRSFADQLKRSFRRLLAEMAHAAVSRPIMISMGMGGMLGAPAAQAGGMLGGIGGGGGIGGLSAFAGGSGIASGLNQLFQGSATGPFQGAGGMGMFGGSNLGFGLSGLGGGLIGSQFGGHGGIGGSLGGMAGFGLASGGGAIGSALGGLGALAGPLGMLGGALLGGLAGSLFGGNKERLKSDQLNLAVGGSGVSGERVARTRESGGLFKGSKWRTYENELPTEFTSAIGDTLDATLDAVNGMLEAVGANLLDGFDASHTIDVKGLSDEEIEAAVREWVGDLQTDLIETALGALSGDIGDKVRNAGGLDDQLQMLAVLGDVLALQESLDLPERMGDIFRGLVLAFDDAEDIAQMAVSLGGLMGARKRDPTGDAASDHALSMRNMGQVFADQAVEVRNLAAEFDGSIEATTALSHAYQVSQQMAYDLAIGLHQTSVAIDALLGNLSARITEDLIQDEEELYNHRRDRVDLLTEALTGMTSPDEIMHTIQEIERLTAQMWSSLADEQRQEMGEGFLGFLDDIGGLAQDRISDALSNLDDDMTSLGSIIDRALAGDGMGRALEVAAIQLRAAETMASAGGLFGSVVNQLQSVLSNIRVSVDVRQPEVG